MTARGQDGPKRLGAYSLGFLRNAPLRNALAGAGYAVTAGPFSADLDGIAIWGDRAVARRGLAACKRRGLPPVFIEDAFLRSVSPAERWPVIGLTIDHKAPYFTADRASDLEDVLNAGAPDGDALAFEEYLASGLSKYNNGLGDGSACGEGFVLVVDQLRGDASIRQGAATEDSFAQMLAAALDENPGARVLVKQHPRAKDAPHRAHFDPSALPDRVEIAPEGCDPVALLGRAERVYCVTSQLGFEAILHGHRPRLFGLPFYAGWGLSDDEQGVERRRVTHSRLSLFDAVMGRYARWFDPLSGAPVPVTRAIRDLSARKQQFDLQRRICAGFGISGWKRRFFRRYFPGLRFETSARRAAELCAGQSKECLVWASRETAELARECDARGVALVRVEDGFLRSRGLGAKLVPPGSLCFDDLGIYYDPSRESRLQQLIRAAADLPDFERQRAEALMATVVEGRLAKYEAGKAGGAGEAGRGRTILVPGQVEDDASILKGAGDICRNLDLLRVVRAENPEAHVIYKPHPDVAAGLRRGAVPDAEAAACCDEIFRDGGAATAIDRADEVWTMTSLLGFEALLRGRKVVCFGRPFYSGWGLTEDRQGLTGPRGQVDLVALYRAAMIGYARYLDPETGLAISVECHAARLAGDLVAGPGPRTFAQVLYRRVMGPSRRS